MKIKIIRLNKVIKLADTNHLKNVAKITMFVLRLAVRQKKIITFKP